MDKKILGKQLKQLRISRGISQEKLSELVFLSPRQMSIIETGNSYPSLDTFIRIAEVLQFDINEFFNIRIKEKDELRLCIIELIKATDRKHLNLIKDIINAIENNA
ncbi:MAG: helix-turn-helix transcriptional regulator [Brachyspira sp.]|nr:helix-turn-helix transcriptional regulator [Brachyspira sp.]CCY25512.1 transcriptional regulator XRE family [Brachyspira sp. CAG:484]